MNYSIVERKNISALITSAVGVGFVLYVTASIAHAQFDGPPPPPPPPVSITAPSADDTSGSVPSSPPTASPDSLGNPTSGISGDSEVDLETGEIQTQTSSNTPPPPPPPPGGSAAQSGVDASESLSARIQAGDETVSDSSINVQGDDGSVLIQTNDDVDVFVSIASERDGVSNVEVHSDGVHVGYTDSGKLLGIFPVSYESEVTVAADGSVNVSAPWYGFLVFGTSKKEIKRSVMSGVGGDVSVTAGPHGAAQVVDIVTNEVSTHATK